MRYSRAIKESVLKKVLPPENRSVREVSNEYGISEQAIRNWIEKVDNGILNLDGELSPKQLGSAEKLHLVLEAAGVPQEELGAWIREKGLHSEHLQLWQQELRDTVTDKNKENKQELKEAKKKIKNLEKELNRKDKALAEMAALVVLKKKVQQIWGEAEDE